MVSLAARKADRTVELVVEVEEDSEVEREGKVAAEYAVEWAMRMTTLQEEAAAKSITPIHRGQQTHPNATRCWSPPVRPPQQGLSIPQSASDHRRS